MKKFLCLIIGFILAFSTLSESVYAVISNDTSSFGYAFDNVGKQILADYNSGRFGDEVYYLSSFGGWGGNGDVAVFLKNGVATVVLYNGSRCKARTLSDEEYKNFISFVQGNSVDELCDWDTGMVMDGIEYEYLHFTKDTKAAVYMNNPGTVEGKDDKIYSSLVGAFWNLMETGNFEVYYDITGANLLIKNEDYSVQSVLKDGDDFKVCIKDMEKSTYDYDKLDWYKFDGQNVGEKVGEPEGVTMQYAFDDFPGTHMVDAGDNKVTLGGFSTDEQLNNYPWQVSWNGYFVRSMTCYDADNRGGGLWLTKQPQEPVQISEGKYGTPITTEEPILIAKGEYSSPVVIPGTDWVVCEKSINGWQNPRKLVKINLKTFEEKDVDLPPSVSVSPVVMLNGKLLISQTTKNFHANYLYDVTADTLEQVYGNFSCLSNLKSRFLQPTSEPDKYYALGNQYTLGIFDAKNYTFTEVMKSPILIYDNDHMWVDEEKGMVYVIEGSDLVSIPLITSVTTDSDIKVVVNDNPVVFDQPPMMQDDRVLVPMRQIFEALGANVSWSEEEQLIVAFKGQKIIMIKMDSKEFVVVDTTGYDTFDDFTKAIFGSNPDGTSTIGDTDFDFSSITQKYEFDTLPQIINDRTLIPVRAVSEALGVQVDWQSENSVVKISCDNTFLSERNKNGIDFNFANILFFYKQFFEN